MTLYSAENYREAIQLLMKEKKHISSKSNFQDLAAHIGIPKSYISKVMTGKANLSSDQLYLAKSYFNLSDSSYDFLLLLLEYERSGVKDRKDFLRKKINKHKDKELETQKNIDATIILDDEQKLKEYYLNPFNSIIHIALMLDKKSSSFEIANKLNISESIVTNSLEILVKLGIIEISNDKTKILLKRIHLPNKSLIYKAWNTQVRALSQQRLLQLENDDFYSLSVTISAEKSAQRKIQEYFIDFLKKSEQLTKSQKAEEVIQLNFDLFPWIKAN